VTILATVDKIVSKQVIHIIALFKACGSRLICDIQMNGELVNAQQLSQEIFAEASMSLKRLFEIT
jgi:hypothetical protein